MVNIGVIGAGYWGKKVIKEYCLLSQKDPYVKLVGVCDVRDPVLKDCQQDFKVPLLETDYNKMLICADIDAVHICTPNETHYQICREAIENGKHVLVEKPMTLESKEAFELVDLAKKRGVVLSVGHIFRFNNALSELRELIKQGFFGEIRHLRLEWTSLMEPPEGRDIITDLAPHPFDIINYLLDDWPVKLSCSSRSCKGNHCELAYIDMELSRGTTIHIEISWLLPGKTRRVSIIGSKRIADCDCLSQRVSIFEDGRSYDLDVEVNNTLETELRHFLDSINNNGLDMHFEVQNSGNLGAKVVELLELSHLSSRNGNWVHCSNDDSSCKSRYSVLKDVRIGEGTRVYDQVNLYKCEIGKNCKIDAFVYIEEDVKIGDNCKIRAGTFIPTGVTIEDDVFIGPNVTFTNDKYPRVQEEWELLPILIKRGASIGANSVILPGITIGERAMVGAGSVVTRDVPDNSVVAGNPARIMK